MRDMAKVVTVDKIFPMYQKTKIVCCSFKENAYEVIIPKEAAIPGNLMIFIEADALLPVKPEWEFLRKRCFKESLGKFLIKPMKMGEKDFNGEKGEPVRSWGLAVCLNEAGLTEDEIKCLKAGDDVTELLGIEKYEPLEDASPKKGEGKKAYPKFIKFCLSISFLRWIGRIWQHFHQNESGGFPTDLISKSDETCLQNMKWALEKFKEERIYISPKWEGQSMSIAPQMKNGKPKYWYPCSRNNAYKKQCKNDFWENMKRYDIEIKLRAYYIKHGEVLILQAEQIGPGIQNNIYDLPTLELRIYTIKNALTGKQYPLEEMVKICNEIKIPFVGYFAANLVLGEIFPSIEAAVKEAENFVFSFDKKDKHFIMDYNIREGDELWKDYFQWEGIVVRSMNYDKDNNIGFSMKIKNLQYQEKGLPAIAQAVRKLKNE